MTSKRLPVGLLSVDTEKAKNETPPQLERRKVDFDLLWSLTGWPPRPAWTSLGVAPEALECLAQMHQDMSVSRVGIAPTH